MPPSSIRAAARLAQRVETGSTARRRIARAVRRTNHAEAGPPADLLSSPSRARSRRLRTPCAARTVVAGHGGGGTRGMQLLGYVRPG